MLRIAKEIRKYATVECDWPFCTNRIDLEYQIYNDTHEKWAMGYLRSVAVRHGWTFNKGVSTCPDHPRKES